MDVFTVDASKEMQILHQQLINQYTIIQHNNVQTSVEYSLVKINYWGIYVNWFVMNDQHFGIKNYRFNQMLIPFYRYHKDTLELKSFILPDLVNIVTSYRSPEMHLRNETNTNMIEGIIQAFREQGVRITPKIDAKLEN